MKVQDWKTFAHQSAKVNLSCGVDVTTPPGAVRASFPYDILPPMRVLKTSDILSELVKLPSTDATSWTGFIAGALVAWIATRLAANRGHRALRVAAIVALVASFARYVTSRRPVVTDVSSPMDVSSHPGGPCCVTTRVLTISNSHAGTHADTAEHFVDASLAKPYDREQYTGNALLVDLSEILRERRENNVANGIAPLAITEEVLREAETRYGFEISRVYRLLVTTTNPLPEPIVDSDTWPNEFAHLSVDGAQYLADEGTHLLLFGIDSPSVDHPSAAPICSTAHGALFAANIAILENLDFRELFTRLADPANPLSRLCLGSVQTVFNPYQHFKDAMGCSVVFYPPPSPHEPKEEVEHDDGEDEEH